MVLRSGPVLRAPAFINEGSNYATVLAQRLDIDGKIRWDTAEAMTAAQYEVGRDADATNQLHFNVPTGAGLEISVNDVAEYVFNATTLDMNSNTLTNIGNTLSSLTGTAFTVRANNAGGNVSLVAQNDNTATAGSHARLVIQQGTGGASEPASDPLIYLTIAGGTLDFHIGQDNSDGDQLKIGRGSAVGTTTEITIGSSTIGFFGVAAVARQTSGANLTNNVTAGGVDDTIANFTDLATYSNDAAAIRNDIYQLARKLKQVNDGLRSLGLLT